MENHDTMNDLRYLRDVVERTQPPTVNHYWPVTLCWGVIITFGYLICGWLGAGGRVELLAWVSPVLIFGVGFPMNWYLVRRVRARMAEQGIRPRFRKDLFVCWLGIVFTGLAWTAGMVFTHAIETQWPILLLIWGSLFFVGYRVNGVLLAKEWFSAAALLMGTLLAAVLARPRFYWLLGTWSGATFILAGLLGRRRASA
jgi:hypothetical protein